MAGGSTTAGARKDERTLRFALPPSVGPSAAVERARRLEVYLTERLGRGVEVVVPQSYDALARELLTGRCDAGWAPPFVCARIEAMGVRVLLRGVRGGASSYRAALLCAAGKGIKLEALHGRSAAWADRDSVGGYLLAMALLRSKGLDPARVFSTQTFAGSYQGALESVLAGKADVTSVFAPVGKQATGLEELWPEKARDFEVVAFTDESPNDGVAVAMSATTPQVAELERTMMGLGDTPAGAEILKDTFAAERFELAPRMGYRALYRVALASL